MLLWFPPGGETDASIFAAPNFQQGVRASYPDDRPRARGTRAAVDSANPRNHCREDGTDLGIPDIAVGSSPIRKLYSSKHFRTIFRIGTGKRRCRHLPVWPGGHFMLVRPMSERSMGGRLVFLSDQCLRILAACVRARVFQISQRLSTQPTRQHLTVNHG
jgi:hypothetical protein